MLTANTGFLSLLQSKLNQSPSGLLFFFLLSAVQQPCEKKKKKHTGRCRTTKDVRNDYRKWELWGMYYLGMMPTADKRLYCTALREAFNSFALKCIRNIWHWLVWPTVDKSVKSFGFMTRLHVSTHFWFLCLTSISSPLSAPNPAVKWVSIWWHKIYSSRDCSPSSASVLSPLCDFTSRQNSGHFDAYSTHTSYG